MRGGVTSCPTAAWEAIKTLVGYRDETRDKHDSHPGKRSSLSHFRCTLPTYRCHGFQQGPDIHAAVVRRRGHGRCPKCYWITDWKHGRPGAYLFPLLCPYTNAAQAQGENRKAVADAEHAASHSAAKLGPITATPDGGMAQDSANRTAGSWKQSAGAAKEAIGGIVGAEGLKQQGIRQNQEGKAQEAQGQVEDLGRGLQDRVGGAIGGAVAGLTGNEAQKAEAKKQHDDGKARQRGVEADLQKQAASQ